jgi:crotonobetainyl-CoA:carnitine CoA-transferase CaiB-like acyl-CoA transferase
MSHAEFRKHNPVIIHGNLTAYGEEDPSPGFDLVLQAETGFMSMNGTAESGPLKMPVALIDVLAAHQLKEALLLALIKRMETGKGSYVSVSLYGTALASLVNQAANFLNTGFVPGLAGSLHPNIAPYGEVLTTKDDKKIVLAVGNDKQFLALCRVLEMPELASDPLFATNPMRLKNRTTLQEKLQQAACMASSEILVAKIKEEGVPAGMIRNLEEVFARPEAGAMVLNGTDELNSYRMVSSLGFHENAS